MRNLLTQANDLYPGRCNFPAIEASLCTSFSKRKISIKSLFFPVLFCLVGLFMSTSSVAQKPPPPVPTKPGDCKIGCTSSDVRIDSAYLVDPVTLQKLDGSFLCQGTASVKLALILSTNTPRVGVVIYANIKNFTGGTATTVLATPSECFGDSLNKPSNKVVFQGTFSWACGTPIVLTDVFIGWGTGNSNFCTGSVFQCPATSSKCFSLPQGQYITIQIPTGRTASQTKCSTSQGGSTAVFNLTESDATVMGSQNGVHVRWYSDAAGTNELTGTSKTAFVNTTNPQTVYAKVCNDPSPGTVCSGLQSVVLAVNPTPAAPVLSKVDNCDGTTTIIARDGNAVKIPDAELTWSNGATTNPISVTSTTAITATRTVNGCPSVASSAIIPAPKITPGTPILGKVDNCNGTSTITATGIASGATLTWSDGGSDNPHSVTSTTALTLTQTLNGCTSDNSNSITPAPGTAPTAPSVTYNAPACDETTFSVTVTGVISGATYTIKDKNGADISGVLPENFVVAPNGSNIVFSNIPAGSGYQVTVKVGNCPSTATSCGVPAQHSIAAKNIQLFAEESQLKVTAYPNPFSDKINFVVNAPVSGKGTLEVYNSLGQKIKTVYQGTINKGTQNFELRLPVRQQTNLIYLLRVGDKQLSGKILQLNQ